MFKRVEKRLKRKQREDELGLDDDMKEVLGPNDTDSDESESDSDSDSRDDIPDADSDNDDVQVDLDEEESDSEINKQSEERALITIAEALTNPIFLVSLDPTINECIVCPGKQLKNQNMVETHTSSKAHERRFKQFKSLASSADAKTIAQDFVEENMSNKPQLSTEPGTSKRAEKKRVSLEKRKAKREKFKARQKAKNAALVHGSSPLTSKGEPSNKTETSVVETALDQENKHIPKDDGGKLRKRKEEGNTALEVLEVSDPPTSPPKKKLKTSRSSTHAIATTTAATASILSFKKPKPKPKHSGPEALKKAPEDTGDKRQKKRKNKNINTPEVLIPLKHITSDPPPSPPKKKRKLTPSTTKAPAPNQKSKPTPITASGQTNESPKVISELQAQVKDIIRSASDLAKAARARALNGGDSNSETKPSATKKMKKKAIKTQS